MPVEIRFAESALAGLQALQTWYTEQGVPDTGARIVASVERLADHPRMGRVVPEFDLASLREIVRPPFRIIYRHESNMVRVVRVWRSERQLRMPAGGDASP